MKNKAFTLSEVLITLGIIGVVAALTLPSVINNTRNKQLEAAFKRNYSVLSQALERYFADYGERYIPPNSNADSVEYDLKFKQILMEYTNVIDKCETYFTNSKGCSPASYTYYDFGNRGWFSSFIKKYSPSFVLNDGSLWRVLSRSKILIDTNGINKKPNRLGYDMFYFCISSQDGKLIPSSDPGVLDHDKYCSYDSTGTSNGNSCALRAIIENDYFKNLR